MNKLFLAQAYNNAWANHRLSKSCSRLSVDELSKDRESFFGSIIATLNHILIVDWFYVSALEGQCIGLSAFNKLVPFPDTHQLIEEQRRTDERLVSACSKPDSVLGSQLVEMIRGDTVQIERFDRTFLHLMQHQIHHRGQIHCMLSGTSVAPPQPDEFYLAWEPDQNLRAADLEAIGTSEKAIWN